MGSEIYQKTITFLILLLCPITVLAPLGTWIPLILSAIAIIFIKKDLLLNIRDKPPPLIFFLCILWLVISVLVFNYSFQSLEKLLHLIIIFISGILLIKSAEKFSSLNNAIIFLSLSFILSALIIILDYQYELGLKFWLSKNLDFKNFENFYTLKKWTSLTEFQNKNFLMIVNYLDNSYDRGISSLLIISFPIAALCYFNNFRILAILVILFCILSLFSLHNLSAFFIFILTYILLSFMLLSKKLHKNVFLFLIGIYFIFSPFILGNKNYKKFYLYEKNITEMQYKLASKYPKPSKMDKCFKYDEENIIEQINPDTCLVSFPATTFEGFLKSKKTFSKLYDTIYYSKLYIDNKLFHRMMIWSFAKEKILEKPILGYGLFSSRNLGEEIIIKDINNLNNIVPLLPLHPHNGILQVWLELGFIGVGLFYIGIIFIVNKIYSYSKINFNYSLLYFISFIQIFLVGQLSYGFWQTWWIALIFFIFFLYKILFSSLKEKASVQPINKFFR